MNTDKPQQKLSLPDTNVQSALNRFNGNEALYISCLVSFLDDPTLNELVSAIEARAWGEAFTAAHALKGLAGNLGFVSLMHATGQLVVLIRGGRLKEIDACMINVRNSYHDVTSAIREKFTQNK